MAMSLENDQGYCPELIYSEQDDDLKGSRDNKQRGPKLWLAEIADREKCNH
jgi:hypothetical protein